MIIKKIIPGFVIQSFDTKTKQCEKQEFIPSTEIEWEENNKIVDEPEDEERYFFPYEMDQPDDLLGY